MFPKIAVPPKPSILIGFSIIYKPSILGYHYFWKHPHCPNHAEFASLQNHRFFHWQLLLQMAPVGKFAMGNFRRRFRWWKPLPYCWGHCCPSAVVQVPLLGGNRESSAAQKTTLAAFSIVWFCDIFKLSNPNLVLKLQISWEKPLISTHWWWELEGNIFWKLAGLSCCCLFERHQLGQRIEGAVLGHWGLDLRQLTKKELSKQDFKLSWEKSFDI